MVSIVGGVLSHAEGFRAIGELAPGLAFHAVTMVGGLALLSRAKAPVTANTVERA